jgi:hypothetical protein
MWAYNLYVLLISYTHTHTHTHRNTLTLHSFFNLLISIIILKLCFMVGFVSTLLKEDSGHKKTIDSWFLFTKYFNVQSIF